MTSFSNFKSQLVKASSERADASNQITSGVGTTEYVSTLAMPTSGIDIGSMAFVTSTNSLYVWSGSAWFNIATANQAPTGITGGSPSYSLAIDGTPTIVTLSSTDPEGFPLTWSYTGDAGSVATVSQTDNVFTITPTTDQTNAGEFNLTFSVTDGNNTETAISVFTLVFLSPLWDETVLSIGTSSTNGLDNESIIEKSTNSFSFTKGGDPQQSAFHPYLDNWSVEFDGTDDYLLLAATDDYRFLTGDFTIEAWININYSDYFSIWQNTFVTSTAGTNKYFFGVSTNGSINFYRHANGGGFASPAGAIQPGKWHHVAFTRDSTSARIYVDGINVAETTASNILGFNISDQDPHTVGYRVTPNWAQGFISNLRVVKGTAVYTSDFTPASENFTTITNTVLLTCQSNRFIDNGPNSNTITATGGPQISAFNPFGQESEYAVGENKGSVLFGSGDKLTRATTGFYTVSSFCMEFWIYPLSNQSHYICEGTQQGSGTWRITIDSSSGGIGFSYAAGSWAGVNFGSGTGHFNNYEWTHIAITKTSTGVYRIFINGVQQGTQTNTSSLTNTARNFQFGYYVDGNGTSYSNALFSDFKITRQDPVYTSDFTVPTAPVGGTNVSINDPYMYLPFDNAGIFDKTGNNTLTLVGNASTSTTQTKFADTAMYFDGTGDTAYIAGGASQKFNIGGITHWTAEFWCNTTASGHQRLLTFHGPQNWGLIKPVAQTTGIEWNHFGPGAAFTSGAGTLPANTWTHVALVRNGSTITCYLNGTSAGSTTSMPTSGAYEVWIGSSTGSYARSDTNGYFENVQFLSGVAKYTTNFTPPTQTQSITYQAES